MDKPNQLNKISRRSLLKMGALAAGALAVGILPGQIAEADPNSPKYPEQLGFMYDQAKCIGCRKCSIACKSANKWEEGAKWRRVMSGARPDVYLSMSCNHCENPVCVAVCPVKAYKKRDKDGIVMHDKEICVGCKYCLYACPYHAPQYSEATGRITKCHFCYERQAKGQKPACVEACPTQALTFGKLADLQKTPGGVAQIQWLPAPELTKPSLVIIPKQ